MMLVEECGFPVVVEITPLYSNDEYDAVKEGFRFLNDNFFACVDIGVDRFHRVLFADGWMVTETSLFALKSLAHNIHLVSI